jgi:hypothetical protein
MNVLGGSYHVVYYNGTSGKVYKRGTSQGYSDDSTWTRGQAWGLYGFANSMSPSAPYLLICNFTHPLVFVVHRRTLNNAYLNMARKMGTYFLSNMPSNGIVPWDFQAPVPSPPSPPVKPADSSAAMIATAGMLLLAHQEGVIANTSGQAYWSAQAMNVSGHTLHQTYDKLLSLTDFSFSCTITTSSPPGSRLGQACLRTGQSTTRRITTSRASSTVSMSPSGTIKKIF